MIKNVIISHYKTIMQRNKEEVKKETTKLIDQGKAAKDKMENMDRYVKEMSGRMISIEKKVDKVREKMLEASMVHQKDKEAGSSELLDA